MTALIVTRRTTTAVAHQRDTSCDFGCERYNGGITDERAIPARGAGRCAARAASDSLPNASG